MRSWRWQGGAGAFRLGVGVLLLGLTMAQSVPPHCPEVGAPPSLPQPQYQTTGENDNIAAFMADFVQSFLNMVQPHDFPKDLILRLVDIIQSGQSNKEANEEVIRDALMYQVGFLVCAAIGIIYIILMPTIGFFLACCRCCGNCGGKMYQKQTSSVNCRRRSLYWSAFITTAIILAGNICMFTSNNALKMSADQGPKELNNTIDNANTFLSTLPKQVDFVVNEGSRTVDEVNKNLYDIGPQLGGVIQQRFGGTLGSAVNSVRLLDQETENTNYTLNMLNSSLAQLQQTMDRLQANVTAVKNRTEQTLANSDCKNCSILRPELQKLTLDTSFPTSSLDELQSALDEVMKTDLKSKIKEVTDYNNSIPERVTNETMNVVQASVTQLVNIKKEISQVSNEIPISAVTAVSETLDQVQREIVRITPEVKKAEHIRWGLCVVLGCVVLLVVVCNFLGLILGPLGLRAKADPTKRSCTADCGGIFLMMSAGFSFLFSGLFMLVVLLLFLLGGNTYSLLCKPWDNGKLLELIDTPGLIPGLEIGPSLGLKYNLNVSDIYRDCEENKTLWTALHFNEVVDLGDLLNVSKYTEQVEQSFENTNINLSSITLLSSEDKTQLRSFVAKTGDFDTTAITQQMNNISSINLNTTADMLDKLAEAQTESGQIKQELRNEAMDLRKIQAEIETTITPQLENLNSTIKSLGSTVEKINGTVGEVLSNVDAAQDFLNTNTTQIVKTESRNFLDCQLAYFTVYADWAKLTITQEVAQCGPVAGAVDSAENLFCSHMVESLNAFWFSLGWCMIFFIPSIIFSIKLAKYYRKMKYSDVYDDHIIMNHIPRAQAKF